MHAAFRLESSLVESLRHSFHISADTYFNHTTCRSANFLDLSRWQAKVLIRIEMLTAEKKTKLKKIYIFSERFVKLDSSSAIFKRKQSNLCFSAAVITVWHYPKWKYVERVKAHFIKNMSRRVRGSSLSRRE